MRKIPKIIPPRSRVRLLRTDNRTPEWKRDIGRQFRVGYYSRKDGLDCIWLVNEDGEYEQTTDRKFLLKYFEIEYLSQEKNLFGRGGPRLRAIRVRSSLERLNRKSSIEAYAVSKEAEAAVRTIRKEMKENGKGREPCLYCSKVKLKTNSRKSRT
jgi:hypothetical protein